jgi:competence ComEA-like helix-hairpin-helix protein
VLTSPAVVPLDLDRASYEELAAIEEIGPTRARAIVWFRENIRPIRTEEDLKSVPGFNDERVEMFRAIWRPKENTP